MPIRVPQLKGKTDEPPDVMAERIEGDIVRRMGFYFPGYRPEAAGIKWGKPFYRIEFDYEDFAESLDWTKHEIMTACNKSYWMQKWCACDAPFACDFQPICQSGGLNPELYEYRKKVIGKNEK